jgi:pyrroline-5-carboxylate reductase
MSTFATSADSGIPEQRDQIAFIGGGNMATAIIGGLIREGIPASQIDVIEPFAEARQRLDTEFGIAAEASAGPALRSAGLVVWAVKPQTFKEAAQQARPYTGQALHLSVAAGIRSSSIAQWLGTDAVVRTMPNTPALVGKGMAALFARAGVSAEGRELVERVIATTGDFLWVDQEEKLDAVTALSGSGPAYVFYFLEAMTQAGVEMGLTPAQAHQLAVGTFAGATELARSSTETPEVLRQRVTSKGGTTYAAITSMERDNIKPAFVRALHAARERAYELGNEFGD